MIQNYSRYKLLQEFFDFPKKDFQVRELSRRIKLAQISVTNHLNLLLKETLIIKEKTHTYPSFRANIDSELFKLLKKQNLLFRMQTSGLLDMLEKEFKPNCIILFGSASRGEDTENSDIDLFVQSNESGIKLEKYEKILNRKINLLFEPNIKNLNKELLNNIINGEKMYGYLKVF